VCPKDGWRIHNFFSEVLKDSLHMFLDVPELIIIDVLGLTGMFFSIYLILDELVKTLRKRRHKNTL
jgi:hypothetical protein